MKTFVVGFNKHNGKMGKRTIKARNRREAMAKCAVGVDQQFAAHSICTARPGIPGGSSRCRT